MATDRPRAVVGRVFASRPARPLSERGAVVQAIREMPGSVAAQARQLAKLVAAEAMNEIDRDPADTIIGLLRALECPPINMLATDPEIDTGALIRAERVAGLIVRGGRRLPERDWEADDRRILRKVEDRLARRYGRILRDELCP